jgi:acetyltransferase-like isoleucine patch superfamily enzyme
MAPKSVISKKAVIGKNFIIEHNSIIEDGVRIGDNVKIGSNVAIKKGVSIGNASIIENNSIIGYSNLTRIYDRAPQKEKTIIGDDVLVRSNSVIYIGCGIGTGSRINHSVVIREATKIGGNTSIGCLVKCEGYASIGNSCSIHSLSSITPFMTVEDFVFIGPGTITLNDETIDFKRDFTTDKRAPRINYGARIGGNSTLCPGVTIGREAFVAAGSLVVSDVPEYCKVAGVPAKLIGRVKR